MGRTRTSPRKAATKTATKAAKAKARRKAARRKRASSSRRRVVRRKARKARKERKERRSSKDPKPEKCAAGPMVSKVTTKKLLLEKHTAKSSVPSPRNGATVNKACATGTASKS